MKKNCVILGAGLIGQQFARMLADHPYFNLVKVIASDKSKGMLLKDKWLLPGFTIPDAIAEVPIETFSSLKSENIKFEVVFSALPSAMAKEYELRLAKAGKKVFSNASAYRYHPAVPIMIPEINSDHLEVVKFQASYQQSGGFIITNSNCSVSGLAILLSALNGIGVMFTEVFVSSYQALSGAGFKGLNSIPRDRVIPFIKDEEEKMTIEAKKILGSVSLKNSQIVSNDTFTLLANCARVPVEDGHLEAVTVKLNKEISEHELINKLNDLKSPIAHLPSAPNQQLSILKGQDRPQTPDDLYLEDNDRSKGMMVTIGRIRLSNQYLRCFLLLHNTIRGGAGGSILNAELAMEKGYL